VNSAPSVGLVNWNPRAVPGKAHIGGKIRKNKKKAALNVDAELVRVGSLGYLRRK